VHTHRVSRACVCLCPSLSFSSLCVCVCLSVSLPLCAYVTVGLYAPLPLSGGERYVLLAKARERPQALLPLLPRRRSVPTSPVSACVSDGALVFKSRCVCVCVRASECIYLSVCLSHPPTHSLSLSLCVCVAVAVPPLHGDEPTTFTECVVSAVPRDFRYATVYCACTCVAPGPLRPPTLPASLFRYVSHSLTHSLTRRLVCVCVCVCVCACCFRGAGRRGRRWSGPRQ
jgi:hypothetical protein